jgi:hypothetical protein
MLIEAARDGSYYYKNPDNSQYINNGQGQAKYTDRKGRETYYDYNTSDRGLSSQDSSSYGTRSSAYGSQQSQETSDTGMTNYQSTAVAERQSSTHQAASAGSHTYEQSWYSIDRTLHADRNNGSLSLHESIRGGVTRANGSGYDSYTDSNEASREW